MSEENKFDDLLSIINTDVVAEDEVPDDIIKPKLTSKEKLQEERELAEARKLFQSGQLSYNEFLDDDGEVRIGIYTKSSQDTPLNKLMEMCDADLPYLEPETKDDYLNYRKELEIEEVAYDPVKARKSKLDDLF